ERLSEIQQRVAQGSFPNTGPADRRAVPFHVSLLERLLNHVAPQLPEAPTTSLQSPRPCAHERRFGTRTRDRRSSRPSPRRSYRRRQPRPGRLRRLAHPPRHAGMSCPQHSLRRRRTRIHPFGAREAVVPTLAGLARRKKIKSWL